MLVPSLEHNLTLEWGGLLIEFAAGTKDGRRFRGTGQGRGRCLCHGRSCCGGVEGQTLGALGVVHVGEALAVVSNRGGGRGRCMLQGSKAHSGTAVTSRQRRCCVACRQRLESGVGSTGADTGTDTDVAIVGGVDSFRGQRGMILGILELELTFQFLNSQRLLLDFPSRGCLNPCGDDGINVVQAKGFRQRPGQRDVDVGQDTLV